MSTSLRTGARVQHAPVEGLGQGGTLVDSFCSSLLTGAESRWKFVGLAWHEGYLALGMVHPYPPRCPRFDYVGAVSYFVTFKTQDRQPIFRSATVVEHTTSQIERAARECAFETLIHCFMPDHLHLIVRGILDTSDGKKFFKLAKQYSGYYFAREQGRQRIWQRYGHDRIIREPAELLERIRYVVRNPVSAELVERPEDYPFWGSFRWSREDVLKICDGSLSADRLLELLAAPAADSDR